MCYHRLVEKLKLESRKSSFEAAVFKQYNQVSIQSDLLDTEMMLGSELDGR